MNTLSINQIVAGNVGHFVILGFRDDLSESETYAQVKAYNPATGETAAGELALPVSILKAV